MTATTPTYPCQTIPCETWTGRIDPERGAIACGATPTRAVRAAGSSESFVVMHVCEHHDDVTPADHVDGDALPDVTIIPAFAWDTLNETLTVHAPRAWWPRIEALSAHTVYGPTFLRGVVDALRDVDRHVRNGYSLVAYDALLRAENIARRYHR